MQAYLVRLLSQLDKNPLSPYYGCFDRDFWHYKMASDFPSATYQMGALSLALAYTRPICDEYYRNETVLEYIRAAVRFWAAIQNRNGSFNEWHPNEQSLVATSFTAWGVSEALLCLSPEERRGVSADLSTVWAKVGHFLDKNIDTIALNHTAGSVACLYNLYQLTGDKAFLSILDKQLNTLLKHQDEEGWFHEYGDPDIGYQSLSIFFLAQYWKKSGSQAALAALSKAVDFLSWFVHPDGSVGGDYASRSTKYLFKYGLHLLSEAAPQAGEILGAVDESRIVTAAGVDDRYFTFFLLPDLLLSHGLESPPLEKDRDSSGHSRQFPNCGLIVHNTPAFQLILNLRKGGAFKLFDRRSKSRTASELGYAFSLRPGKVMTSLGYGRSNSRISQEDGQTVITIKAGFMAYQAENPLARLFILFRLFNLTCERSSLIHRLFDRFLKLNKVKANKPAPGLLERELVISGDSVRVRDRLVSLPAACRQVYAIHGLNFRYVPSSQYSHPGELLLPPAERLERRKGEEIVWEHSWPFS